MAGDIKRSASISIDLLFVSEGVVHHDALAALLTGEERHRAGRYLRRETREEFVIARGCLRLLLARALDRRPGEVPLEAGEHGKLRTAGIEFNVSHSNGLIAIALSPEAAVGIDIEGLDRRVEVLDVARTAFSSEDAEALRRLADPHEQRKRFFELWTAQEAVAKCAGTGLAAILGTAQRTGLHVRPIPVPPGYLGAICTSSDVELKPPQQLTRRDLQQLLQPLP